MNKVLPFVVLVVFACGCQAPRQVTSTPSTSAMKPSSLAPTVPPTPSITITPSPAIPTTPSPLVENWSVYHNDLLGYEFSYPPQATISSSGPDFYSTDDVPPDMAFDYFALLESIYSDWLCVQVS